MKRTLALLLSVFLLLGLVGCGQEEPEAEIVETVEIDEPEEIEESEFYTMMQSDARPFGVMIDNDNDRARPQIGLESAYLVYEAIIEGGCSRFFALFKNPDITKIGPIRSARHYFLDYAQENDAIYIHTGWSNKAATEISSRGINNINGLYESIFWRDNTYDSSWHNHYTGLDKAKELAEKKGYRLTTEKHPFTYFPQEQEPTGEDATTLSLAYSSSYKVSFIYNEETGVYDRMINGKPHKSQTGDGLTAENIIVYTVTNVPLNDGINAARQDLLNTGSGEGYYLYGGKAQKITWEKATHDGATVYQLENGDPLVLNPGNTYIELVPASMQYTIE